jgi:hypothetical protein
MGSLAVFLLSVLVAELLEVFGGLARYLARSAAASSNSLPFPFRLLDEEGVCALVPDEALDGVAVLGGADVVVGEEGESYIFGDG